MATASVPEPNTDHHWGRLLSLYLEPKDIMHQMGIELYGEVCSKIMSINGSDDDIARKKRVEVFLDWFQQRDCEGNKQQQLLDVLGSDLENGKYKWLVQVLKETEKLDKDFFYCFEKVDKPEKVKKILGHLFPAISEVCRVDEILKELGHILTEIDKEEIDKVLRLETNHHALFILLNKLIYKKPSWIRAFIQAVRRLGYSVSSRMFEYSDINAVPYKDLAEALEDYLDAFDTSEETEEEEMLRFTEKASRLNLEALEMQRPGPSLIGQKRDSENSLKEGLETKKLRMSEEVREKANMETDFCKKRYNMGEVQFDLREYQKELSKSALRGENVVICAPTNSGKTIVAANIINEHLKCDDSNKVVFFTPTGGLAEQQYKKIQKVLPHREKKVALLHGNMENQVDKDFCRKIHSHDIIVMTPKILLNCLESKSITTVFDFSLMIFDECHHARSCHPYSEILHSYWKEKKNNKKTLQIIGLTATLGIGAALEEEQATAHIFKLLGIMDASNGISLVREHMDDLNERCPAPKEDTEYIDPSADADDPFKNVIKEAVRKVLDILTENSAVDLLDFKSGSWNDVDELNKEFENWAQKLRHVAESHIDTTSSSEVGTESSEIVKSTLGRDTISCANTLVCLKRAYGLCENCQPSDAIDKIEGFLRKRFEDFKEQNTEVENRLHDILKDGMDKLNEHVKSTENKLLKILEEKINRTRENDENFRCMIMVARRLYAACLQKWAKESDVLKDLGSDLYIGVGTKSSSEMPGMTHNKQSDAMKRFNKGDFRVLICTPDAAGEGIDVENCNLVLTIDCVNDEIQKVQLAGRARKENSKVIHVYFRKDETTKDELTIKKTMLMIRVTKSIDKMFKKTPDEYKTRLDKGRRDAIQIILYAEKKKSNERVLPGRRDPVLCRGCSKRICTTDQLIKVNRDHHTINLKDFKKMYCRTIHKDQGEKCGKSNMRHVNRIQCKNCKCEWGNEVDWKGYLIPILRVKGFKIEDRRREKVHTPNKWKNAKLKIQCLEFSENLFDQLFKKSDTGDMEQNSEDDDSGIEAQKADDCQA